MASVIVHAVVAMCHTLNKVVVAEGIETDSQFQFLRKAGADVGQGFRIGRPMDAEQFALYVPQMQERADNRLRQKRA